MAAPSSSVQMSPFDDPNVKRHQRTVANAAFKAFNAVANRLLVELGRIYPNDAIIRFFSKELAEMTADKTKTKIPALNFFREVRKPAVNTKGENVQYVDLLVTRDEMAFQEPIPVTVLRSAGLAAKYRDMNPEVREILWSYVERLVGLSLKAVINGSENTEEMNRLTRAVKDSIVSGKKDLSDIVADPAVQQTAIKLVDSIQ